MKVLFKTLKTKHFPGLKVKLVILKEKRPNKRATAGYHEFGCVTLKSWVKYYTDDRMRAIIIHELTHAASGNGHSKRFASKLLKFYKQEFPTSYRSVLRREWWNIGSDQMTNGLVMMKKYWPERLIK